MLKDAQALLFRNADLHVRQLIALDVTVNQLLDDVCLRSSSEWTSADFYEAAKCLWILRVTAAEISNSFAQFVRLQVSPTPPALVSRF